MTKIEINPDNDVENIIQEFADSKQIKRREIQKEEILQRCFILW